MASESRQLAGAPAPGARTRRTGLACRGGSERKTAHRISVAVCGRAGIVGDCGDNRSQRRNDKSASFTGVGAGAGGIRGEAMMWTSKSKSRAEEPVEMD